MKLPQAEHAIVELDKLTQYCLNPMHPEGRHKARVFASALGITADDAERLRAAILTAMRAEDAKPRKSDDYGQRYAVEFQMDGPYGPATVRTGWIILRDEEYPRLLSCYVRD